jgi:hypothetical protein
MEPVMKKQPGFQLATVRFPLPVFARLRDYQKENPHMSLNALIVEAVIHFLESGEKKEEKVWTN